MKFQHITTPFEISGLFENTFHGALVAGTDECKIPNDINHSWDGELYWMPKNIADIFLPYAESWFQNNLSNMELQDEYLTISNCLIYSHTPNGTAFFDTQIDMGSIIDKLIAEFDESYPELKFADNSLYYGDCHLPDNLKFGRDSIENGDAILTFLYEEGVIAEECFFYNLDDALDAIEDKDERKIVLTGTFPIPREELADGLESAEFQVSTSVSKNSWLWVGKDPGASKVKKAKDLNIEISNILDLMKWYLSKTEQTYIERNF